MPLKASDGQPSTLQTLHQFATLDVVWSHTQFTLRCCLGPKQIRGNPSRLVLQVLGPQTGSHYRRRPIDESVKVELDPMVDYMDALMAMRMYRWQQ
jgi:hypothetical protein